MFCISWLNRAMSHWSYCRLQIGRTRDIFVNYVAPHPIHLKDIAQGLLARNIGWMPETEHQVTFCGEAILFRGSLHLYLEKLQSTSNIIMVFDTTAELFRKMSTPVVSDRACLFEMYGMLGMCSFNDEGKIIDIWMMEDYESEVWSLKYRVELPVAYLNVQFGEVIKNWNVVVDSCDGNVLVLVRFGRWLLQFDIDGKLVTSIHHEGIRLAQHRLKQTLVPHTFFPMLDGYYVTRGLSSE
ncbi:hypothetical protein VPH35_047404 [Triticum aestivum]